MVANRSVEDAIVVCLMLAVQEDHVPVRSTALSKAMGVSDSYLKKTLRKLVVAKIVNAVPGKAGGFALSRSADEITISDIFQAIEGDAFVFRGSSTARGVFPDCPNLPAGEIKTQELIAEAGAAFLNVLAQYPITNLLRENVWVHGVRDWRE